MGHTIIVLCKTWVSTFTSSRFRRDITAVFLLCAYCVIIDLCCTNKELLRMLKIVNECR